MFDGVICQMINGERYEIFKMWIPNAAEGRLSFIRKYFHVMDREKTPRYCRRRKNRVEYADTALKMLARIDCLFDLDVPIAAGSKHLSDKPWAVFGEGITRTNLTFIDFDALAKHYTGTICSGGSRCWEFHFKSSFNVIEELAKKHKQTRSFIFALAIFLLYDLIVHCGPDCRELYDLFTNDMRDTPDNVDIESWEDLRCKVMGRRGQVFDKPFAKCRVGQLNKPRVRLETSTKIELLSESDDLENGERLMRVVKPKLVIPADDERDDGTLPVEQDMAMVDRMKKHPTIWGAYCQ
jgi:hypothetical protein